MRLAVCYTVFNGLELLEKSIEQIRDQVDVIIICYQKISNTGNENVELMPFLRRFSMQTKIHLIEFAPDLRRNTKENEINKHNLMLEYARLMECSHFLLSACDHFYDEIQFVNAKNQCEMLDFDVTFTKMYTYFKHPTYQLTPIEDYYMPFICKLHQNTRIEKIKHYPVLVDPSVQVNTFEEWNLFEENEIMMHHYSMVRINIKEKFKNAAASIRWTKEMIETFVSEYKNHDIVINPELTYFQKRKIKVVPNYFNL